MGTSTSWIAIEGSTVEQVAWALRLTPSSDATNDTGDSGYLAAMLPAGWVLVVRRMESNGVVADRELLKELSSGRRVVGCDEESHVMYSASSEWRDGREVWVVIHSSEDAADHLEMRGDLPSGWAGAKDELIAMQAEAVKAQDSVDYVYEVPLSIAKLVVGYRSESDDDDDLEFVTLVPTSSKPWWKFW
jgi:hypothetical protein